MITIQSLTAFGADVKAGLSRCMNNEAFYLRLVNMELGDANFDKLKQAYDAGDVKAVFEAAHALKGALGNLSLTPIYAPVNEITERTRGPVAMPELTELLRTAFEKLDELKALA